MSVKIGFIGAGNMGSAIAKAITKSKIDTEIFISDPSQEKCTALAKATNGNKSNNELIAENSDIIFLAVKPQILGAVIEEIKGKLNKNALVISMAAGTSIKKVEEYFSQKISLIRIMPNIPVEVGEGVILYASNENVTKTQINSFLSVMEKAGTLDNISEHLIDAASAISGCGPAYVYMMIESIADAGVALGLPRDKALLYASKTLSGASIHQATTGKHPEALKDAVCSPGGTTIAGVKALEDGKLRATLMNAVIAAYNRTKELNK